MGQAFLRGVDGGSLPDGYIKPEGTARITDNGEYDVTEYANVLVSVESGEAAGLDRDNWNAIHFYDYDGTLLHVIPLEDVPNLTELPPLPMHEGLVCQGWNWTLEEIQSWDIPLDVGPMYITDDGATRFVVDLESEDALECSFSIQFKIINIDWGDGSPIETCDNGSTYGAISTISHKYAEIGKYCISIYVVDEIMLKLVYPNFWQTESINSITEIYGGEKFNFGNNSRSGHSCLLYNLKKITLPTSVTTIPNYAFSYSVFDCIIIPSSVTSFSDYSVFYCCSMKNISFPNNNLTLYSSGVSHSKLERLCLPNVGFYQNSNGDYLYNLKFLSRGNARFGSGSAHSYNYQLERVVFSKKITAISMNGYYNTGHFIYCNNLKYVDFPPISDPGGDGFSYCPYIRKLTFASSVSTIGDTFCNGCKNLKTFDFTLTQSIPSLTITNAFDSSLPADYEILVKGKLYPMWKRATNWSRIASHIKPIGDYAFLEPGSDFIIEPNESCTVSLVCESSYGCAESVMIEASNPSLISISNQTVTTDTISFDVTAFDLFGDTTITVTADIGGNILTSEINATVFDVATLPYTVEAVEGATYGFEFNENGWWESTNQGVGRSYSLCKIVFTVEEGQTVYVDCINFGDAYYCFGILSKIDTALGLNYNTDSSSLYQKSFYNLAKSSVQTVTYSGLTAGEHFIYAKYKKQSTCHNNNDSLQFQVRIV